MRKVGSTTDTADANGEYTNGNVAQGISPTIINAEMLNTFQREMVNVVEGSGIVLDPADDGQVLKAIKNVNINQSPANLMKDGYQILPSGLILQWGDGIADDNGFKSVVFPKSFKKSVFVVVPSPTNRPNNDTMVGVNIDNTNYRLTGFDVVSYGLDLTSGITKKGGYGFTWYAIGE